MNIHILIRLGRKSQFREINLLSSRALLRDGPIIERRPHQSEISLQKFRLLVPRFEKNHQGDHIKSKIEDGKNKADS